LTRDRLRRVDTTREPAPVLEDAALIQAWSLIEVLRDDQVDLEVLSLLGWLCWYRYQALPEGQAGVNLNAASDMFTPCFLSGIDPLPEPLLPTLADRTTPTALALLKQTLGSDDLALPSDTIQL